MDRNTCVVCMQSYESEDGMTYDCDVCGRIGFCSHCSKPENHDCTEDEEAGDEKTI